MNDIPTVEDLLTRNILLNDIDLWMGTLSENLQTKCAEIQKYSATAKIQQPHMLREQH